MQEPGLADTRFTGKYQDRRRSSHDEAVLLVLLARWHMVCGLSEALSWLWNGECSQGNSACAHTGPARSPCDRYLAQICAYLDAVAILHKRGLLHYDLLFDWLPVGEIWDRMKGYVLNRRQRAGSPVLWQNLEDLATAYKQITREYST